MHTKMCIRDRVSTFQALCISLSATIGTGNITGVATAVATVSYTHLDVYKRQILVIQNVVTTSKDMHIFMLPDFSNKEKFLNKLEEVEDFLKEIKK